MVEQMVRLRVYHWVDSMADHLESYWENSTVVEQMARPWVHHLADSMADHLESYLENLMVHSKDQKDY